MGQTTPHITSAELRIMKILWKQGPLTVRQVKDVLTAEGGEPPAYTTVMTMMKQLADKGALRVDRRERSFVYSAALRRGPVVSQRLAQFLRSVFDDEPEEMVLQLVEQTDLSAEDLRRIQAKIAKREKEERESETHPSRSKGGKR